MVSFNTVFIAKPKKMKVRDKTLTKEELEK